MLNTDQILAATVRRLGSPVSTILLQTPCLVFSTPDVKGIIGYQRVNNCAVVIGDPICVFEQIAHLTQAFHQYCQKHDLRVVYLLASETFADWAINNGAYTSIQVGEELFINPVNFRINQKLRWKINKSIKQGITIEEYLGNHPALQTQMRIFIEAWKKAKQGPQIHLGNVDQAINGSYQKTFYAIQNDKIVGLLTLSPVDSFQGWVLSSFLAMADAPQGTTEHLLSSVIEKLANQNCHFLCLGAASGSHLGQIVGLNPVFKFFAHLIFQIAKWYFKLYARTTYLYKYHPNSNRKYLLTYGKLTYEEVMAIKQVINVKL